MLRHLGILMLGALLVAASPAIASGGDLVVFDRYGVLPSFRSPPLEADEEWILRFEEPGVYRYQVEEHRGVDGTVIVE